MILNLKKRLTTWLINQLPNLLNASSPDLVLRVDGKTGKIFLGGKVMNDMDREVIARDAKTLESSKLWKIMIATLDADANERIVIKSTTWDDVWAGKMQLYNLQIMKKIITLAKSFAKLDQ